MAFCRLLMVKAALEAGVCWFDVAQVYGAGRTTSLLGAALRAAGAGPDQVHISTKWWPFGLRTRALRGSVERQIRRLDGYPLTLLQPHFAPPLMSTERLTRTLAQLVRGGQTLTIGASNYDAQQLEHFGAALRGHGIQLCSAQMSYSLWDRRAEGDGLLAEARRQGLAILAYRPLARGLLTRRGEGAADAARRDPALPALLRTIDRVAEGHGATPTQVALAWVLATGPDVFAVTGARDARQVSQWADAMSLVLDPPDLAALDTASRALAWHRDLP